MRPLTRKKRKELMIVPEVPAELVEVVEKVKGKKKESRTWLLEQLDQLSEAPPAHQCAVGAAAGAVNGFIFGRLGKNAAAILSGSLVLLQMASYMGYVQVNWKSVEKDLTEAKKEFAQPTAMLPMLESAKDFLYEHAFLGGGFIGGFVVGLVLA